MARAHIPIGSDVELGELIAGGGSFNGGMITEPLEVESDTQPQVTVRGVGTSAVLSVEDDSEGTGGVTLTSGYGTVQASGGAISLNNLAGTETLAALTHSGLYLTVHTAPDPEELVAGDCYLWFDQSNGAPKLMVTAATADGTVVNGEVALA